MPITQKDLSIVRSTEGEEFKSRSCAIECSLQRV